MGSRAIKEQNTLLKVTQSVNRFVFFETKKCRNAIPRGRGVKDKQFNTKWKPQTVSKRTTTKLTGLVCKEGKEMDIKKKKSNNT